MNILLFLAQLFCITFPLLGWVIFLMEIDESGRYPHHLFYNAMKSSNIFGKVAVLIISLILLPTALVTYLIVVIKDGSKFILRCTRKNR